MAEKSQYIPSSFAGGSPQAALSELQKTGNIRTATSSIVKPEAVKRSVLPQKKVEPKKWRVKVDDGTTLAFDSEPTTQDIEEAYAQVKAMPKPEKSFLEKLLPEGFGTNIIPKSKAQAVTRLKEGVQQLKDLSGGLAGSIPEQIGNIGKFTSTVGNALTPGQPFKQWGDEFQKSGTETGKLLQGAFGARPDSLYTKGAEFAGEMAGGTILGGGLVKGASILPKVGAVAQKLPFLTKVVTGATEGLGFDIASQGEVGAGTLIGGGLPFVGATFNKAKNLITSTLPKSFIARGMATPSALKNASERLSRLADDGVLDIDKAPEWMLKKGLQGSKPEIQKQLTTIIKDSGKKKVELLASGKPLTNVQQVQELQQGLGEVLTNFAKISKKGEIIPTAGNKDIVEEIVAFINNKSPTAVEFERARSLLGNMGIFTKGGALADSAQKEGLQKIWIQASKYLDETFPGFRELNKDIEVANALGKAIGLKEAQDSVRNLLTFTNLGMGGLGATYGYSKEGNIGGALTYGAGALGARYILNNPAVLTRLAQGLSGNKLKSVLEAIQKVGGSKATIPLLSKPLQND